MESPLATLSRSPSTHSIYAPGPHRRSHPNLQAAHLSLAPLTPRYPIDPADYLAYTDPDTSNLHTSASISHIASLPSPVGILTNSPNLSRANSRTRLKRKVKSHVSVVAPADAQQIPSGAVSSAGYGHSTLKPLTRASKSQTQLSDASWLVQTGLALTESSRENKGQSWLGKRDSSTSLVGLSVPPSVAVSPVEERERWHSRSGRATPGGSRGTSRTRRSRRDLAMTAPVPEMDAEDEVKPNWADKETQAEVEEEEVGWDRDVLRDEGLDVDDDPYGELNFDGHFDTGSDIVDEEEIRRELSRGGLGRWIDGVVDVFLMLEEDGSDDFDADRREGLERLRVLAESVRQEGAVGEAEATPAWDDERADVDVPPPPPDQPQGVLNDVRWLAGLLARNLWS